MDKVSMKYIENKILVRKIISEINLFYTLLIVLISNGLCFSQKSTINGSASLSDGSDKEGIIIQLLDKSGVMIQAFRTTDSFGKFTIDDVKYGNYVISYNQFGYRDSTFGITTKQKLVTLPLITLFPLSITTDEVSIIDKAILFKKSGDTTIFNLKNFETGSEQSVTDIIQKIHGFEIKGSKITHNGKAMDAILIDGVDVSDFNHIALTDAVHYKSIEDVRLIENYNKSRNVFGDSTQNSVALDIKIKQKYKGRSQYTFEAKGGFKNYWGINGTLIKSNKKSALNISANTDNLNEQDN
ncbi:MAG TPA: hypothetical protein PKD85_15240, partial [Saprospiraceae bacterium]|nr:hypothetical protein [Saprospiraceae bacterium]